MKNLPVRNEQTTLALNIPWFRQLIRHFLGHTLGLAHYSLGIRLVDSAESARVNHEFVHHEGPTDVITFDYSGWPAAQPHTGVELVDAACLHGELVICPAVAQLQAPLFKTTWTSEMVRYVVHGILHLRGYDDLDPARRRLMKKEENRLVALLAKDFVFAELAAHPKVRKLPSYSV